MSATTTNQAVIVTSQDALTLAVDTWCGATCVIKVDAPCGQPLHIEYLPKYMRIETHTETVLRVAGGRGVVEAFGASSVHVSGRCTLVASDLTTFRCDGDVVATITGDAMGVAGGHSRVRASNPANVRIECRATIEPLRA